VLKCPVIPESASEASGGDGDVVGKSRSVKTKICEDEVGM